MRAEIIARALDGQRCGAGWTARCPAHDDYNPSLSLRDSRDGKLLVHSHAGCPQATVLSALRAMGLSNGFDSDAVAAEPARASKQSLNDATATDRAWRLWFASEPAAGTLVDVYLKNRGLTGPVPPTLRFLLSCWHAPSRTKLPAMIAAVWPKPEHRRDPSHLPVLGRYRQGACVSCQDEPRSVAEPSTCLPAASTWR